MKLFQQKTTIQLFKKTEDFLQEFPICETDFILASKTIYEKYFASQKLLAHVEYKSKYGVGEPTDVMMNELMKDFSNTKCNRIIAIGGGAVIDMAKLLVLKEQGNARDIFEKKLPFEKVRELIAIPTTCGAGSEVSNVTITELTALHTKMGLATDELYADYAILIPELLKELPFDFFATSAIDALIHAIESYVSPRASLYTELFSEKAIVMIVKGFQEIIEKGKEHRFELLEEFLLASNMAGIAFGNAGTGSVHAMSYPLSGEYHVTHGEANYQLFTGVFKAYAKLDPEGKLKGMNQVLSEILNCEITAVYESLEALLDCIIPRKPLREYGMKEIEISSFTDSVMATQQRLLNQSYVRFTREEMMEIYQKLY
ncbi:MAG: 4-hydroxybutyrate dehydrogenase [Lachnospiraceae bacterium]